MPLCWYETGIQVRGDFYHNKFSYEASLSSGLDASLFNTLGWIKNGYQIRTEQTIAESLALSARLDYHFGRSHRSFAGIYGYINNANPNRPTTDLDDTPGRVKLVGALLNYDEGPLRFNISGYFGDLQNSDIISKKNSEEGLSPVGKQAVGFSGEIGYDLLHFNKSHKYKDMRLYPFVRYDYYDTMHAVEGDVVKDGIAKRNVYSAGLNWMVNKNVVIKAEYRDRTYDRKYVDPNSMSDSGRNMKQKEINLGVGYSF